NVFENIRVPEVLSDKQAVQRNLVDETIDRNGKRLSYHSKAGVITLDKQNSSVTFLADDTSINEVCVQIEQKFNIYKDHYPAQQLPVMVNKIMQSLAPTPVRKNGGIYFIPATKSIRLKQLIQFLSFLDNSEGYKVPVIYSTDNRIIVITKICRHIDYII